MTRKMPKKRRAEPRSFKMTNTISDAAHMTTIGAR
jgi:hypothetical protein